MLFCSVLYFLYPSVLIITAEYMFHIFCHVCTSQIYTELELCSPNINNVHLFQKKWLTISWLIFVNCILSQPFLHTVPFEKSKFSTKWSWATNRHLFLSIGRLTIKYKCYRRECVLTTSPLQVQMCFCIIIKIIIYVYVDCLLYI